MRSVVLTLLAVILLGSGGCSGTTMLMPTPNLYSKAGVDPFPDVPAEFQNNYVDVMYMTDRQALNDSPDQCKYGFKRSRSIAIGTSRVQFGEDVSWDELAAASRTSKRVRELPVQVSSTRELVRFPPTPRMLLDYASQHASTTQPSKPPTTLRAEIDADKEKCQALLSSYLAKTPDKSVYIFVHGYNNTFDDSVMTIAQLWHFFGRQGVPVAYSWPAGRGGLLRGYTYDRESSEFTVYHLKEMIYTIAANPDVKKIHIIAHSRGTGVLVSALAELNLEIMGSGKSTREVLKLGSVVLAAPDIDLDVVIQRAATMRLGKVPQSSTIYVCAKDKALGISNWLFGGVSRVGDMRSTMFQPDELALMRDAKTVAFVDARISDAGPYGHSYFHANPAVSSDLVLTVRYQRPPGAEFGRPLGKETGGMWSLEDSYPLSANGQTASGETTPGSSSKEVHPYLRD